MGIKAKEGIPTEFNPLTIDNEDKTGIQIEDTIRNNSEPRIPSIEIGFIEKSGTNNYYILVKIQRSWNSPHRVKIGGTAGKFYLRRDRKNDEMDIFELRTAFNLSETLADKIKRFREERISNILADETPVPLHEGGKLVIHLIPLNAFYPGQSYDLNKIYKKNLLGTISDDIYRIRFNFDGILEYGRPEKEDKTTDYTQIFRNGIIEAATTYYFDYKNKLISPQDHELAIVRAVKGYLGIYGKLNVEYPVLVFVTLVGVKGYKMGNEGYSRNKEYVIDKNVLTNQEIVLEKYPEKIGNEFKPVFEAIRNACGFQMSRSYDKEGNWRYD